MNSNPSPGPSSIFYQAIAAAFCVIVVMSNIISAKMVALPLLTGFVLPAGLLTYPLTFLLSDLTTEVFGAKKAQQMVYVALAMNILSLAIIQIALMLPAADGYPQDAFTETLGLSGLRIFASLTAYIISQTIDIHLYAAIKKWTGARFLWLRNNGSTCVSQLADTVLIDTIYLYLGLGMSFSELMPIMCFSYGYKAFFSAATTPLIYFGVYLSQCKWAGLTRKDPALVCAES